MVQRARRHALHLVPERYGGPGYVPSRIELRHDVEDGFVSSGVRHGPFPTERHVQMGLRQYPGRAVAVRTLRNARRPRRDRHSRPLRECQGRRVCPRVWRRLRRRLADLLPAEHAGPAQRSLRGRWLTDEKLVAIPVLLTWGWSERSPRREDAN